MASRAALAAVGLLVLAALCAIPMLPPARALTCTAENVDANGTTTVTAHTGSSFAGMYVGDEMIETDGGGHIPTGDIVVSVSGSSAVLSEAVSAASDIPAEYCSLGSISPSQGPAGVTTTISGSGFSDSHTYYYCYEAATATPSACSSTDQLTTDGSGNIPSGITVTASGASNGYVVVYDPTALYIVFSQPFTITDPNIVLNPTTGAAGTSGVSVTGSGFSVNTAIGTFTFAGSTPLTQTCTAQTTSATGAFSCTFTVPGSASAGANTVTASGGDVGSVPADTASATFTVSASVPEFPVQLALPLLFLAAAAMYLFARRRVGGGTPARTPLADTRG